MRAAIGERENAAFARDQEDLLAATPNHLAALGAQGDFADAGGGEHRQIPFLKYLL
jgi:hypothetical protein